MPLESFTLIQDAGEILTAAEVAALLKCSRAKVYQLHAEGALKATHKIFEGAKGWRWTREDVEQYLKTKQLPGSHRHANVSQRQPRERTPRFVPVKLSAHAND